METQRSNDHRRFEESKAVTSLLRRDPTVPRGPDGAIHYDDVVEECGKKKFNDASQWPLADWISILAQRWRSKEKISMLLESKLFQSIPVLSSNSRTFRRKCY